MATRSDFEDGTAWERTVLAYAFPVMPLTASDARVVDLRTNDTTIGARSISVRVTSFIGGESAEALRNSLLPLLFGASWKVLDLALELAFAQEGLAPQDGGRWTIGEKSRYAAERKGKLPGLSKKEDIWKALGRLYEQTVQTRHALVHRRVEVNRSTLELTGYQDNGAALLSLSHAEQTAFCLLAHRVGQVITEGELRPRLEADLRKQLADLKRHHEVNIHSNASNRPPVRVIDALPASGQIDVPALLRQARETFPQTRYVDLELRLADGRTLVGELESAPQATTTVDPTALPDWLSFL